MSSSPRLGRIIFPQARLFVISLALAAFALVALYTLPSSSQAAASDLFISEYIEGSGFNKALEIYNGTGSSVDLAAGQYRLELYTNGSATVSQFVNLTGTIAPGDVFVIANSAANAAIIAQADATNNSVLNHNGDDAFVLRKGGAGGPIVDVFGQVGLDPGTEWGTGLASTADNTLRRKSTVCAGDTNPSNAFDPAAEWDGFVIDTFDGFGSHTASCGTVTPTPTPTPNPGVLQFSSATYSVAENGSSASITVSRTGGSDGAVSINYATSNNSATGGDDYTPASGTLNFANGENSKSFSVAILDDIEFEGDETVNLTLSSPTGGATLGSQAAAVLTITDNENPPVIVPAGSVVISQIYGGGGNNGAVYTNDFIEIFNRSSTPVNLAGWSVQYSSSAGSSWSNRTNLSGTLAPGQYYLIQEASGGSNGTPLPAADIDPATKINMSATSGKVALVRSTAALTGDCPVGGPTVIDFVGYGDAATCKEGPGPAPQLSASTAALRARNGCKDTDYNAVNFTEGTPTPRNSSTPLNVCPVGDEAPEVFTTTPTNGEFNVNLDGNITINFDQVVNVAGNWFQISCGTSGLHTAVVTGGPASFTLNPDTDFAGSEQCTVTIYAANVTDQDAQDPPDNMAADYVFNFRTFVPRDPAEHMVMGNPSGATTDTSVMDNYLMMKDQYALSYNNSRAIPNWTSWHLDTSWVTGVSDRQNDFRPDDTLPPGYTRVASGYNFATYGFDRGHMVPSADRTSSVADNSATFLMTNMIPQASGNNQGPWADLENHLRTMLNNGANELYIVAGGQGVGGTSSTGNWDSITDTGGNSVTVPKFTWKVIMVLPSGDDNDVARVNASTRTFAVIMPNDDNIREDDWKKYLATVDQVEALTGQNYFSNVPEDIQNIIEARLDDEYNTAPVANSQSVTTNEDTPKEITLTASDFNVNNVLTYSVVDGPQNGSLSDIVDGKLTYTPNSDYNGPDSFTFKVNDGGKDSNVATVSITVTAANDAPVADAGDDQTVECTNSVTLDGTGSSDPEGDTPLSYEWREGANVLGTGATLNVTLGSGPHVITLKVTDPGGASSEDTVNINVVDTIAPTLVSNGQTISLWPANKKLHTISVSDLVQSASDSCDSSVNLNSVVITNVTSDEGSASSNDIVVAAGCKSVQLRADRNGNGDGRVYTITFMVEDAAGNQTTLARQVVVPHNQGNSNAIDSGAAYTVTSGCQ